jgi:hypothetical protein
MKPLPKVALIASMLACSLAPAMAEPTALELIKRSNQHVATEARDQILQVRSEKSVAGLAPSIWCVVHFDPTTALKTTEVKFGAGSKMEVNRPLRVFNRPAAEDILALGKVRVDSDRALKIAQKERLLANLKLTNSRLVLERWEGEPVWKVQFWAEKTREATRTVDIGHIFVNAEDGAVVNRDLHIERVE